MRSEETRRPGWKRASTSRNDRGASDQLRWLVDNGEAYEALVEAIRGARESIWISQLAFDADCRVYHDKRPGLPSDPTGERLLDIILAAIERHGVRVRILLNSSILLNTKRTLARAIAERIPESALVELRGINRFPQLLHAKMAIVDGGRAFLMGSPFVNGYWDSQTHPVADVRRPNRELGGRAIHDVSVEVRGSAARELSAAYEQWWSAAGKMEASQDSRGFIKPALRPASQFVEVVTTEPAGFPGPDSPGSTDTREALLSGIRSARRLIYIEHQYLSSRPVVDALRFALDREKSLEIVMLLNQNPDVTAYRGWQNARFRESGLLEHPRVGVFSLWTARGDGAHRRLNQVFVHSKVVTCDDSWAMVGSANLDGASLDSYGDDFSGKLARRVFRNVRNFDVSLVFNAEHRNPATMNPVTGLRARLWMEHLKRASEHTDAPSTLDDWRSIAARNADTLNRGAESSISPLRSSFILPYSTKASPRAQLSDAGVQSQESIRLEFEPGWVERNLSPNWFRNMFG